MDSIAEYINEEKDVLYVRGQRKARVEEKNGFVKRLLQSGKLTIEEIAEYSGVTVAFVINAQKHLD